MSKMERKKMIALTVSDEEHQIIRTDAEKVGMTISAYIRWCLIYAMHKEEM